MGIIMRGEWCYFCARWKPEYCQAIIDVANAMPSKDATIGIAGTAVQTEHRRSKVSFLNQPQFDYLFDELWKLALQANRDWFNFHFTHLEFLQVAKYQAENRGEYRRHQDVFWLGSGERHRKLSCIVQLSDPTSYEGGDFELYDCGQAPNRQDLRQQGTVIFFPSFIYHAALPVTQGVRYSLAAWFEGPKWR